MHPILAMKNTRFIPLIRHSTIFFTTCALSLSLAFATPQPLDKIAAIVDDSIITANELEAQLDTVRQQIRAQNTMPPPSDVLLKQVLEREIIKKIQLQLAKNTGIFIDDNALNATIENIAAQNKMNLRQFRDVLERDGFKFEQFREDIRGEMAVARLKQREINSRIFVTDQEIDNFIATQEAQGQSDAEFLISHILIAVPEAANTDMIEKTKNKANKVLKDLNGGASFSQTAISFSDGQQALKGGDLGWRKSGQLPSLFSRLLPNMKKGDISDLIRSPSGFHIIKLNDKRVGEKHVITQTLVRHILLKKSELTSETELLNRIRQLRQRIKNGDDFAEIAKSHSDDDVSASRGGSLDWVNPGEMVPQFEAVVEQLKKNEISEPFQTPFGWHIAQVLDRRTLDNSEEFVRNQARDFIRQRKVDENTESWLRRLRDEAYVEIKIDI